ncbi:MAG: hypothetical protein IPF90_12180 [Actinomycetales bacterium]|jgi:hypothetical protein|nr:hypothetical protein [Candidatus Phosphoribacter baldrii]
MEFVWKTFHEVTRVSLPGERGESIPLEAALPWHYLGLTREDPAYAYVIDDENGTTWESLGVLGGHLVISHASAKVRGWQFRATLEKPARVTAEVLSPSEIAQVTCTDFDLPEDFGGDKMLTARWTVRLRDEREFTIPRADEVRTESRGRAEALGRAILALMP